VSLPRWRNQRKSGRKPSNPINVCRALQSGNSTMIGRDGALEAAVDLDLQRQSAWTLPANRYGRVLFAGDAAHLVPIFGRAEGLKLRIGRRTAKTCLEAGGWSRQGHCAGIACSTVTRATRACRPGKKAFGAKSTEFMAPQHHGLWLLSASPTAGRPRARSARRAGRSSILAQTSTR